jgi:ribonuclease P protein component
MYGFSKAHRLCKADEFSSVFIFRKVRVGKYFKLHYKPNQLTNSRLGFMVSKKVHKRANQRNYIKRIIREYFRVKQINWYPLDLIVRAQKHFTKADLPEVISELDYLCNKFQRDNNVAKSSNTINS